MFLSVIDSFESSPNFGMACGTNNVRAGTLEWIRTKNSTPHPTKNKMKTSETFVIIVSMEREREQTHLSQDATQHDVPALTKGSSL